MLKKICLGLVLGTALVVAAPVETEASDITACFQWACTCSGVCSFDSGCTTGEVESWTWQFGDGTNGTGTVIQHTYSQSGDYEVRFVASRGHVLQGNWHGDLEVQIISVGCS